MTAAVARPATAVWSGRRPPSESTRIPLGYASRRALRTRSEYRSRRAELILRWRCRRAGDKAWGGG
eukprot:12877020-Ditylum_brightwellii.AAC.1